ncbi:MAG: hypothetical protein V8T01_12325 [Oscillospiraceae bacterium]
MNALVKERNLMIALAQTRIDAAQADLESLLASAERYFQQEYDRAARMGRSVQHLLLEAKKMMVAQFNHCASSALQLSINSTS